MDAHRAAEPDAVRAINDRPHGLSLRLWRSRVRDVTRGGDHDAPSARGTVGRALLRRNPRVVPLSLGVPVGVGRRRPLATALRASSRLVSALSCSVALVR